MQVNWEISIGSIISAVATILTLLGIAVRLFRRFDLMDKKVSVLFATYLKQELSSKGVDVDTLKKFFDDL